MNKKTAILFLSVAVSVALFAGCAKDYKMTYNTQIPVLPNLAKVAFAGLEEANAEGCGWYLVFNDEFDDITSIEESERWTYSPHGLRSAGKGGDASKSSWWSPSMVSVENGNVVIRTEYRNDYDCPDGICPREGIFTGGIETRIVNSGDAHGRSGDDTLLFGQAFGYFEARVKLPEAQGMWSAFWLQSTHQRKLGNYGEDGTEIDVYESAFLNSENKGLSVMGHALLWDGYSSASSRSVGTVVDLPYTLYDGDYHTFGVLWTPECYVFYIDGSPTWITDAGGVSKVKEFLRLTVEVDEGDEYGPHGRKIGAYANSEKTTFYIDRVTVYQNTAFAAAEKPDDFYKGKRDEK
ncbi:MAG: glycoside hydrolase family 16 protein [Clostridiales bacterium]|jgi:hypothetical protein|nr:glycoside hydrolase family 16 protein [Clostridiales bacterium]